MLGIGELVIFERKGIVASGTKEVIMRGMKRLACWLVLFATMGGAYADTAITAYGIYWDGDDPGRGAGLRVRKTILAFLAAEGRAGYVEFTDSNTEIVPMEASVIVRMPFVVSPYAGVGAGHYFVNSDIPGFDDFNGGFVQLGVEASILWFGAMAEVRYYEMEEDYLDGAAYSVGLLLKF